jgi:serine/threonine protein kinase
MGSDEQNENRWLAEQAEQFDAAWGSGEQPRIEDYLAQVPEALRSKLLANLLAIELERRSRSSHPPLLQVYQQRFEADYPGIVEPVFAQVAGLQTLPDPRSPVPPPVPPGPGAMLPDPFPGLYRFVRKVGGGGFGDVFEVVAVKLGDHRVAAKKLKPNLDPAVRSKTLLSLQEEAATLSRFRHRNIVLVHAWLESNGEPYLILEYVPGGSLAALLEQAGKLPWPTAARYVADVADALLAVHQRGILHRDIKPANILLNTETDEAMLTDFGIAVLAGAGGEACGTPAYMAPEAFSGLATELSDVYSLAVTFLHLGTGELPFPERNLWDLLEVKRRGLVALDPRLTDVPDVLEPILRAGLEPDPQRRVGLKEFATRLRAALAELLIDGLPGSQAAAFLRLFLRRPVGPKYELLPTEQVPLGPTKNVKLKSAPEPRRGPLRTGETLRIEAVADQRGYLSILNVGPTGDLAVIYPREPLPAGAPPNLEAHRQLAVGDIELEPPAGRERLLALWSRHPLAVEQMSALPPEPNEVPPSAEYRATRVLEQVRRSLGRLAPADWQALVVEFEHGPHSWRPWQPIARIFGGVASWAGALMSRRKWGS